MKKVVAAVALMTLATPAYAQFEGLKKGLNRARQLQELQISEEEERQIGAAVSEKIRERFGVVQDRAIHRYVSSVGLLLAHESSRASLSWAFVVLDTDGVNAFAAPGGFIHITKGALALIDSEAELAGVLGHEIAHVTSKHTIKAIQKSKAVQMAAERTGGNKKALVSAVAGKVYEMVLENSFDRDDERDADQDGIRVAAKVGYAPAALADFLARLGERNRNQRERNGLFASHPALNERIGTIRKDAAGMNGAAHVKARYDANVSYQPTALTEVPQAAEGSAGLAGSSSPTKPAAKNDPEQKPAEPKKKGFGLSALKRAVAPESPSAQVSASGGARGVGPDRNAKGGSNPALVTVNVSAGELASFRKGIA